MPFGDIRAGIPHLRTQGGSPFDTLMALSKIEGPREHMSEGRWVFM
jgi:hypothetical protein